MLNPIILDGLGLNLDATKDVVGEGRLERGRKLALVGTLDPEGASVLLHLDVHAPKAVVGEAQRSIAVAIRLHAHRSGQLLRQGDIEVVERQFRIDGAPEAQALGVMLGVTLESPIADQLGVDSSVATVVDILVQEAILVAARLIAAGGLDLDVDGSGRGHNQCGSEQSGDGQHGGQRLRRSI